ncbi:MAG: hypothetical protein HY916_02505 [Desulfovibrio sp.]|jgi:predicted amidophosphoribosyltransferase|nr:hypothetical protein [Desulfovibrio sp.]
MQKITLEHFAEQEALSPGRRCFSLQSGLQLAKQEGRTPSFNVKFFEGIGTVFEQMTGLRLRKGNQPNNYYCYLETQEEIQRVQEWEQGQGSRVFLRDCLTCSIALDHNFAPNSNPPAYTPTGQLEHDAKQNQDTQAIAKLVEQLLEAIRTLPPYAAATVIAAVPARKGKDHDLPTVLVSKIVERLGLDDVTGLFIYAGDKGQLKATKYDERWGQLAQAGLGMDKMAYERLRGKSVILIDDKYQSGVTANFVAMVLQQHGAAEVYGLYAVKTWGDRDNC